MDKQSLMTSLRTLNESEEFYKNYQQAKESKESLGDFLKGLDIDYVLSRHLLVPELPETIPPEFKEEFFFDMFTRDSIFVQKHNCYAPALFHKHTFFEFFYVLEGNFHHEISDQQITMHTGDVCMIPPGIYHKVAVYDESIVLNVLIRKSTFEDFFFNILRGDNILSSFFLGSFYSKNAQDYIIFHTGTDYDLKNLILDIFLEFHNKERYHQELTNSLTTTFFAKLLRSYERSCELPPFSKKGDSQAFGMIQYIQSNYQDVTLEKVAEKFHYTPEYTSKFIKTNTGYTFTEILMRIRLERSEALLRDTNIPIGEISYQLGYMNPESYIRNFKKQYNITPSAYRKRMALGK